MRDELRRLFRLTSGWRLIDTHGKDRLRNWRPDELPEPSTRTASLLQVTFVFVTAFLLLAAAVGRTLSQYDEGIIVVGASRLASGAVPHRDFYANYGPGQFAVVAAFFKMFGTSILAERLWDTVARAAIAATAFLLLRRVYPVWLALSASAVVTIWLAKVGFYGYPVFPCLLFSLAALHAVLVSTELIGIFGAGALVGVAALFRYDAGFYVTISMTLLVTVRHFACERTGLRQAGLAAIYLCLGIALICLPYAIFLLATGSLYDFFFQVIKFPTTLYVGMRNTPFPDHYVLAADPSEWSVYEPPIIAALCGAILLIDVLASREIRPAARWTTFGLILLSLFFYPKGMTRPSSIQMAISFLPAILVVFASVGLIRSRMHIASLSKVILASAALFVLAWPTIDSARKVARQVTSNLEWFVNRRTWTDASAPASCVPPPVLDRMRCFTVPEAWGHMVEFVATHTAPTDAVFAGLSHHDRIVVNDVLFYFAVNRAPATRWYHFDPGLQTSEEIQQQMVADLKAAQPSLIVLYSEWEKLREPNKSAISSDVHLLDDYIASEYHTLDAERSYSILAR